MFTRFLQSYQAFQQAGVSEPLLETLHLFDILSKGALRQADAEFSEEALMGVVAHRQMGGPLEYGIGRSLFMGLELLCSPAALIPRQETELLVKTALSLIAQKPANMPLRVVDMATGSGNIAVSLAYYAPNVHVIASDISPEAIELARQNSVKLGLQTRISLMCGDAFAPVYAAGHEGKIDMVVCNPPYVPTNSLSKLPTAIREHEPVLAFDAGPYGINFYRQLVNDSCALLKSGGVLIFEIGSGQDKLVKRLLEREPHYGEIHYYNDGEEIRVISAVKV